MNLKLLFLLLIGPFLYGQINLEKSAHQLNEFDDQLTIKQAIEKESQGLFSKPFPIETYKIIKGEEVNG